mmetsp:Transcript_16547/g.52060  ORF Transcript_16547/g.52060 Transcript_16547/m.52060 type:complete len:328 (-) Transcript_16547:126-1109(-)
MADPSGRVACHCAHADEKKHRVQECDAVRGGKDPPEGMDLAVGLCLEAVKGHGPIHSGQSRKALLVGLVEKPAPILENEALNEPLRIAEKLIPIIVVGHIWREESFEAPVKPLPVFAGLGIHVNTVIPLIKDCVVDGAHNSREEEAAAEGAAKLVVYNLGSVVEPAANRPCRCKDELSEQVEDLWHESHVPSLAPDQKVHCNLRQLLREHVGCGVTAGLQATGRGRHGLPLGATQLLRLLTPIGNACLCAPAQRLPPTQESIEQLSVEPAESLHEQATLVNLQPLVDGPVCNQRTVRAPQRHQVVVLVLHAVRLEVKDFVQGTEEAS